MPPEITSDFVKNALNYRHPNYNLTISLAESIKIHAEGLFPEKLIAERRPSESLETFTYRKKIYEPITKESIGKVFTELQKIRRSKDWSIAYDDEEIPKVISSEETLEKYCEENYPGFDSVTNWTFAELLRRYLIDANSFVAMVLKESPKASNEYPKPIIEVFSSDQVLDHVENEYVVLKSADKNVYKAGNNRSYQGDIIYIITTTQILRYKQVSGSMELDMEYNHNFGYLPAFKAGGEYKCRVNNDTIYESRIHYMVPELNEAVRENSDLQAEIVQHIHSEKYYYTNTDCPDCRGFGKNLKNKEVDCKHCNGSGRITNISPYGVYLIDMAKAGEQNAPAPPMGYIQKDTTIAKLQDDRVEKHLYKALASINMEFLSKVQLNQSGIAKEVDRDALNTFVNSIAEDIVRILDKVYKFICDARYSVIIPNEELRDKLLPSISVPEKFDILNSGYFLDEIVKSEGKINPNLNKYLQIEYTRKRYHADPLKADELQCIFNLDPFYGNTQDEKMTMLANNGITELDYVISCNIVQLVNQAINEKDNFLRKTYSEKKEIIKTYAQAIIAENTPQNIIKENLNGQESSEDTEDTN